jgi:flagellar biosynthesis/type III secretory pathway M-ring protein FliF/YscJ
VDALAPLVVILLAVVVVLVVSYPLRRGRTAAVEDRLRGEIEELEAAKAAKYREIRELELDLRTGKLDEAEFRRQDRERRAEAVELLRRLDALGADELAAAEAARPPDEEPAEAPMHEPAATIRR